MRTKVLRIKHANGKNAKCMKKEFNLPQYNDVICFTCLFYPLISGSIGFIVLGINNGVGIIVGSFMFCFFVYLPFTILAFICMKKKMKRARACISSTFLGLMSVYCLLGIIAYSLEGASIGFLGFGLGFFILFIPYILCCCIYLILLRQREQS